MSGHLGRRMIETTAAMLTENGLDGMAQLERSSYASALPLIGVARHAPPDAKVMRVFDFGQTAVKVGTGHYENGALVRMDILPSRTAPQPEDGAAVLRRMTEIVHEVVQMHPIDQPETPLIVCSIASYVIDGQPVTDGFYGRLKEISEDVTALLSQEFSAVIRTRIQVRLMHDGTSAAQVYAGSPQTAVITMGTALGIGFAPPETGLRPLKLSQS
jgi:hypothetical protein